MFLGKFRRKGERPWRRRYFFTKLEENNLRDAGKTDLFVDLGAPYYKTFKYIMLTSDDDIGDGKPITITDLENDFSLFEDQV